MNLFLKKSLRPPPTHCCCWYTRFFYKFFCIVGTTHFTWYLKFMGHTTTSKSKKKKLVCAKKLPKYFFFCHDGVSSRERERERERERAWIQFNCCQHSYSVSHVILHSQVKLFYSLFLMHIILPFVCVCVCVCVFYPYKRSAKKKVSPVVGKNSNRVSSFQGYDSSSSSPDWKKNMVFSKGPKTQTKTRGCVTHYGLAIYI